MTNEDTGDGTNHTLYFCKMSYDHTHAHTSTGCCEDGKGECCGGGGGGGCGVAPHEKLEATFAHDGHHAMPHVVEGKMVVSIEY